MQLLTDWDGLQRAVGIVPRGSPGYTSNLYASADQVARWCAVSPLLALSFPEAVLILRGARNFHYVYHAAANLPALTAALGSLPAGTHVTDLVGRGESLDQVGVAYTAAGFCDHVFLARMSRIQAPSGPHDVDNLVAAPADVPAVRIMLDRLLDRFAEQLPDEVELREAAEDGRLLVVHRPGGIAGMLMYDIQGQSAHLRFWHVDEDARGAGVGRRLMADFQARCAHVRRIVLWVIGTNDRSIAIYQHYGFAADGLIDRIMISHKDCLQ